MFYDLAISLPPTLSEKVTKWSMFVLLKRVNEDDLAMELSGCRY